VYSRMSCFARNILIKLYASPTVQFQGRRTAFTTFPFLLDQVSHVFANLPRLFTRWSSKPLSRKHNSAVRHPRRDTVRAHLPTSINQIPYVPFRPGPLFHGRLCIGGTFRRTPICDIGQCTTVRFEACDTKVFTTLLPHPQSRCFQSMKTSHYALFSRTNDRAPNLAFSPNSRLWKVPFTCRIRRATTLPLLYTEGDYTPAQVSLTAHIQEIIASWTTKTLCPWPVRGSESHPNLDLRHLELGAPRQSRSPGIC
jgi:hypothetical protein